jgi:hypothetical protein
MHIAPGTDLTEPADPYWGLDFESFKASTAEKDPPRGVAPAFVALWWAAKGDWDKAHAIVMDEAGMDCAWVHAYLHRVEGDLGNAGYWYREAGKPAATGALAAEWAAIARDLLAKDSTR